MSDAPLRGVAPGEVVWAWLDPTVGREQAGRRPVLVVSSDGYNEVVTSLLLVLPISSVDRRWPNHVPISGPVNGFAMTEQLRAISRARIGDTLGHVSAETMDEVRAWLGDFLDLPAR